MSERFQGLFRMPSNQCAEGCPIVIEEGALLKDTNNGRVLAQLKLKNISAKEIVACKVCIRAFEPNGNKIEGKQADYLDICAKSGASFGSRQAIYLPNNLARSAEAEVVEVVFGDGNTWFGEGAKCEILKNQQLLSDVLADDELYKQAVLELGEGCKYLPAAQNGVFQCTCGAVYLEKDGECYSCHRTLRQIEDALELKGLRARADARLAEEEENRQREQEERERILEQQRIKAAERRKRVKKIAMIVLPILVCIIAASALFTQVIMPKQKLNKAIELIESGDFKQGFDMLQAIGKKELAAEPQYLRQASKGDIFCFGSYEQDDDETNGKESIRWRIIDKSDQGVLVLSEKALDCVPYNNGKKGVTWEKCTLRTWLNGEFFEDAFSKEEQERVLTVNVSNPDNPKYGTNGGNATMDKVFLLSLDEANRLLPTDDYIKCEPSAYAKSRGVWIPQQRRSSMANCNWFLRSPGCIDTYAAEVFSGSLISPLGVQVNQLDVGIRPALWVSVL